MSHDLANLRELIRRAYHADVQSGLKASSLTDIPYAFNAIDPAWFTCILCRSTPGAEVIDFQLGEPNDGSSNRRQFFITYNEAGRAAGLPATVFCKGGMEEANRVLMGYSGFAAAENAFYKLVRDRVAIDAPRALHSHFDPRSHAYIVVMEDLTGLAEFGQEDTVITFEQATDMVFLLADLHAQFHEDTELGAARLPFRTWAQWWRHMEEVREICDRGFGAAEAVIPPSLFAARDRIWDLTRRSVDRHAELPQTLIHSDVHMGNWYRRTDGRMGLCDWQITCIGTGLRDFILAMSTSLRIEDRRRWENDLLTIYLERLAQRGVTPPSVNEAFLICRQQLFSALAFWTVTLRPAQSLSTLSNEERDLSASMPEMQSRSRILQSIERIAAAMDDNGSLAAFDQPVRTGGLIA